MRLFTQNNFIGGLDTELDATKTPQNSYPLAVNCRARRDIIEPTYRHSVLADFSSTEVQGVYTAGATLIVFAGGIAYSADLTVSPVNLIPISSWTQMVATGRIYAQLVVSTTNFFNRTGSTQAENIGLTSADLTSRVFNASIAGVPQALFCFDGSPSQPQAIIPGATPRVLNTYEEWTANAPEYVPNGYFPCIVGNKLFLVLRSDDDNDDQRQIGSSVSGRMSDFVIAIAADGSKQGDATALATQVSYHKVTSMFPLPSGQLLVSTLYASYIIDLNYDDPIFGEPNLLPSEAFPVGAVNNISNVDILGDTAFITQSGIQSFNAVAQLRKESNNLAFGAKIRGLLLNPQTDTAAGTHDDYAMFAINSIFGRGVLFYDTIRRNFQSLDLSFGNVLQFANTRVEGDERLFFATRDNKVYEAFADTTAVNAARVYVGEWSADNANQDVLVDSIELVFTNVKAAGQCKITLYADREKLEEVTIEVPSSGYSDNFPIQIPFTPSPQVSTVGFQFTDKPRAWKIGALIEWNFDGALSNISFDGAQRTSDNAPLAPQTELTSESFAFVADTGFGAELNDGAVFSVGGFKLVAVTLGQRYIYDANGDGVLVNGLQRISEGTFTARAATVAIGGTAGAVPVFSLKLAENFLAVLDAIYENEDITAIIGGGDHSYENGTAIEVEMGLSVLNRLPFHPVAGDHDYNTSAGTAFFNAAGIPRFYEKAFDYVEFFFYNGGWTSANVPVNSSGITTGATSEPYGNISTSLQAAWLRSKLAASTAVFKIIIVHEPPYTTDNTYSPGYADLRFLSTLGAHAVLSGHGHVMERIDINGFPFFVCGVGGKSLNSFKAGVEDITSFRSASYYGYLEIKADALTCELIFRDTNNNALDSFSLYAR